MSKTLITVLEVAAVVAVQAIPGVGQAVGVALGVSAAAGAAIAAGAVIATEAVLNATVFAPKAAKPDTTVTATKGPLAPRVGAFGRSRLYGNYDLYVTAPNGVAADVFSFVDTWGNPIDDIERIYLGDDFVASGPANVPALPDGKYGRSSVTVDVRLGSTPESAFPQIVGLLPGVWTDQHRGDGIVSGATTWAPVKAKYYQEVYPNGQPAMSIVARWYRCFDWRDGSQSVSNPGSWKWTENACLHYAYYVLVIEKAERGPDEMFPSGAALQAAWNRYFAPTLASWTAAANDCGMGMPLKAGGTEERYRSCVSFKFTDAHKETKARIAACFDGWVAEREDRALVCYSGRYYAPTVSLGPDEIVSYSLQEGVEDENAVNDIAVTYVSAAHDFSTVDAQSWQDEDDISQRGAIRSDSLADDVPSHAQARRLAKRKMAQAMSARRGSCTTNSAGRAARGQRFVHLDLVEAGVTFFSGPVEITQLTRNLPTGGVTFSWRQADPNIDAWNPATEEGNPAPTGDVVAPVALDQTVIASAAASFAQDAGDGAIGARAIIVLDLTARDDITYFARWRVAGSVSWNEQTFSDIDAGPAIVLQTGFVPVNASIEVAATYSVGDGRVAPWSATTTLDTSTEHLAPAAPSALSATGGNDVVAGQYTNPISGNLAFTRLYIGSSTSFGSAVQLGGDQSGDRGAVVSFSEPATAGTRRIWAVAYNAAGDPSTPVGPVTVTVS